MWSRFTHAFETEVRRRTRDCSIAGVCRQWGLHGATVMRLIKRRVEAKNARVRAISQRLDGIFNPNNLMLALYHVSWM